MESLTGTQHAVVFERDCGATTDFSFQVSILPNREVLHNGGGNVFIADGNHGKVQSMYMKTRWSGPQELVISYPKDARLFRHESRVKGTAVVYQPDSP
jgi:hypothetical protein